jgi:drug/metabolite transporter (DMT)-like permease
MQNHRALHYALLTVFFWSTVATAFKLGLGSYSPARLLMVASLVSLLVFLIILSVTGELKEFLGLKTRQYLLPLLLGLLNPFAYYLIIFEAYSLLPAQVAQPVNMVWPLVMVLLSVPLLGKRMTLKDFLALMISFFGIVLISSQGSFSGFLRTSPVGILLCLASSVIWSLYWILSQKSRIKPASALFLSFLSGTTALAVYLILIGQFSFPMGTGTVAGIYIGLFEMGISFFLWLRALSLAPNTAKIANLVYLAPFLSLVFIHFFIGEGIFWTTLVGLILIVGSIFYQQTGTKMTAEPRL